MSRPQRGPRLAAALLRVVLPRTEREDVLAELDREHQDHVLPAKGWLAARAWYWRQVLGSIVWRLRHGSGSSRGSLEALRSDLRFAVRLGFDSPGSSSLTVGTIALGIGVSTAVFSVLNGVVLKPLPYPASDELVRLWPQWNLSKGVTEHLREHADGFADLHGYVPARDVLVGHGEPSELYGLEITPGYLSMLGAVPVAGRFPLFEETEPGRAEVVVLSEPTWRRLFGGRADAIGSTIELGGESTTVIGVVPASFSPLVRGVEFWRPMTFDPDDFSDYQGVAQVQVVARLADVSAHEQASASVHAIATHFHEQSPNAFGESWVSAAAPVSLHESLVSDDGTTLWTVMGAAAFVLLTACTNVANLMLARSSRRHREIAVRIGLGATTSRIARQMLTESLLVGVVGGSVGVAMAAVLVRFAAVTLPQGLPLADNVAIDAGVLAFGIAVSLVTALLFGAGPALRASRLDPQMHLRESAPSVSLARTSARTGRLLVGVQIALAVILAVGAGLMLRSLRELNAVETGISASGVTTMRVRLPGNTLYAGEPERAAMFAALTERLQAVPGVDTAAASAFLPMASGLVTAVYRAEGVDYPDDQPLPNAAFQLVHGDYFRTLGISLLAGRSIELGDTAGSAPVGVINAQFAQDAFGSVSAAIGKTATMFGGVEFEVVGVVANSLQQDPTRDVWPEAFFSYAQAPWWPSMYMLVSGDPDAMPSAESLRAAIWEIDAEVPVLDIVPMDSVVRDALAGPRYLTMLLTAFGSVGLVLGAIGVYGLTSFAVNQRLYEFGIRAALGASRRRILVEALREAVVPASVGVAAGVLLAGALTASLRGVLFGIAEHDPVAFAIAPVTLLVVAVLASYLPARSAAGVDPKRLMT